MIITTTEAEMEVTQTPDFSVSMGAICMHSKLQHVLYQVPIG